MEVHKGLGTLEKCATIADSSFSFHVSFLFIHSEHYVLSLQILNYQHILSTIPISKEGFAHLSPLIDSKLMKNRQDRYY